TDAYIPTFPTRRSSDLNDSVFIKGKLDYSSFTTDDGSKRNSIKLVPNQVSLCKSEINFDDEKFEPVHEFTQVIVFNEINQEMEEDRKSTRLNSSHVSIS